MNEVISYRTKEKDMAIKDIAIIERQLNRTPRGLKSITSRCAFGYPQSIETKVFIDGDKPFPTLYWLTCPLKVKAVSQLEGDGWSERINKRLRDDKFLQSELSIAQEDYKSRRRQSAIGSGDLRLDHPVFETGIGGVRDLNAVKCLHAHYAHFLAGGANPIGKIVDKQIGQIKCKERCG